MISLSGTVAMVFKSDCGCFTQEVFMITRVARNDFTLQ